MVRRPKQGMPGLLGLIDHFTPTIRDAFMAVVADIKDNVIIAELINAISEGDPRKAVEILDVTPAIARPLIVAIETAFETGGVLIGNNLPPMNTKLGGKTMFRFDVRNSRAEAWLRVHSSDLITRINADQLASIRNTLTDGLSAGRNPRSIALDLVGRIGADGRRVGGVVGLSGPQERYVSSAQAELSSEDPNFKSHYFTRTRRDARFDSTVQKSIDTGVPLTPTEVDTITARYSDSLLQLRGETIGRTEALTSLNESQSEAINQAIDTGTVKASQVTREWDATMDNRTRPDHRDMDGQQVGMNEPFTAPDGSRLMFPGDFSLGADQSETINCRCRLKIKINFLAELGGE